MKIMTEYKTKNRVTRNVSAADKKWKRNGKQLRAVYPIFF